MSSKTKYVKSALSKYEVFNILDIDFKDEFEAHFNYDFDGKLKFTEKIRFDTKINWSRMLPILELYHLAAGVSYYKAYPTKVINHPYQLSQNDVDFLNAHYHRGLGEFVYVNQLSFSDLATFDSGGSAQNFDHMVTVNNGVQLVAIGGGKDSLVTIETLNQPLELFRVNSVDLIEEQARIANKKLNKVTRRIDPLLLELNNQDALNGHVPITNLVTLLGVIYAANGGYNNFVLSNESSANIPNTEFDNTKINHQYSKSKTARKILNSALRSRGLPDEFVYSFLEDMTELEIVKSFCRGVVEKYSQTWNSSNQNFKIGSNENEWLWSSPKTLSVFGMMAAYCDKDTLLKEFNLKSDDDPFLDSDQTWKELFGLQGHKPFECVADIAEMRQALELIDEEDWPGSYKYKQLI